MTMFRSALLLLALVAPSALAAMEGDSCGIVSADFFKPDFGGNFSVSGDGCSLGEGKEQCYCMPNYEGDRLSEWIWQCAASEGFVEFGPIEGKTCPTEMPVNGTNTLTESLNCNVTLNPTGLSTDPVCAYSTCGEGEDGTSSVCACIDKSSYGLGEGVQWVCLHSTCDCPLEEEGPAAAPAPVATSAGNMHMMTALPMLMVGAALVAL
jgi:hypothetical protein